MLVNFLREQQRDIDVDAFANELLESRNAFSRAGNFDHHVGTVHCFPKAARFFERALRVAGKIGRNLQADITIATAGLVVDRTEQIGSVLDIANCDCLVACLGVQIGAIF